MSLLDLCRKYASNLIMRKDPRFYYDVDKQKKYVQSFTEPKNRIERSYFQYRCQMKLLNIGVVFLYNITSLLLLLFYSFKIYFGYKAKDSLNQCDAITFANGVSPNVLPKEVSAEFPNMIFVNNLDGFKLLKDDWVYIFQLIRRYPLSWHFILKNMLKILDLCQYSRHKKFNFYAAAFEASSYA